MINRKYVFSGFNILIYAQNYILKFASTSNASEMKDQNRDQVYKLYEYALELEPKPDRDELTFAQQQLVNRARSFVTMKMKRRQNLRDQKKEGKSLKKLRKLLSDQLMNQQEELPDDPDMDLEEPEMEMGKKSKASKEDKPRKMVKAGKIVPLEDDDDDTGGDGTDWVSVKTLTRLRQKQDSIGKAVDYDDPDLGDEDDGDDEIMNITSTKPSKKKKKKSKKKKSDKADPSDSNKTSS